MTPLHRAITRTLQALGPDAALCLFVCFYALILLTAQAWSGPHPIRPADAPESHTRQVHIYPEGVSS